MKKLWDYCWGMFKKYQEVISYLFFGGLTTLVNMIVYWICTEPFKMYYQAGIVVAWVVAVLFAYVVNKIFVFQSKTTTFKEVWREFYLFIACRIASLLMEMACMFLLFDLLGLPNMVAKLIVQIMVVLANYFFSKLIIFRKTKEK